jgi:hypothetical protein
VKWPDANAAHGSGVLNKLFAVFTIAACPLPVACRCIGFDRVLMTFDLTIHDVIIHGFAANRPMSCLADYGGTAADV